MAGPVGTPFRVKQDLGRNALLTGFTAAGQLTMIVTGEGTPSDLFVLSVDPSTGEARGELTAFAKYPTDHFFPRWSPDGSRLAYTSRKGQVRKPNLFVGSLDGKSEEEIPANGYFAGNVEWSPDGTLAPLPGLRPSGRASRHLPGPAGQPPDRAPPPRRTVGRGHEGAFVDLRWLPLAKRFTFGRLAGTDKFEIYTMDADGRQVERVAEVPTSYWTWPSPDGRRVAYRQGQELKLLTLADKTSVTLATFPEGTDVSGPAWSPDGRGSPSPTRGGCRCSHRSTAPRGLSSRRPRGRRSAGSSWSGAASPGRRTVA